jgi:arylsulfatase A-like enzyme
MPFTVRPSAIRGRGAADDFGPRSQEERTRYRIPARYSALAVLLLVACARKVDRPNVLLITIDTLRADRISAAGYPRATTPNLDRLAAEGLRFTHVETPRAKTTPAIATIFTGMYPHEHGVRDLLVPIEQKIPLLTESLHKAGYATGAIVGNYVLQDRFSGLARGFDSWCEDLPDKDGVPPDDVPQRRARSMTDGALAALGLAAAKPDAGPARSMVREGEPWFLWIHYMDPHGLYDPPPEHRIFHRETPDLIPDDPGFVAEYNVPSSCRTPAGRVDAALVRDLYDGEVHYVDAEIGRLVDALRANHLLDKTLVVVVADHGESLGEHRCWFEHGRDAFETTCRVPLVARLPASAEARAAPGVRNEDFSLADLAPTILDWLGLPKFRDTPASHPVFAERIDRAQRFGVLQSKAVRIGDWKLIRDYAQPDEKRVVVLSEALYDLARDPGETVNRISDPPPEAPLARLQVELLGFAAADVRFTDLARSLQSRREQLEREDPEALRILQKLGY